MITAQLADGRRLEFPGGTDPLIIQAKVKELLGAGIQPPEVTRPPTSEEVSDQAMTNLQSEVANGQKQLNGVNEQPPQEDGFFGTGFKAIAEIAAGANKSVTDLIDFLGPDQVNNILQLSGSDSRVPTLGEQPIVQQATTGGFIEGKAGQALRMAGQAIPAAVGGGQIIRQAAQAIPKLTPSAATTGQAVTKELARGTTAAKDVAIGAAAGGGGEVGAQIGEDVGGEKGKDIGRIIGGIILPISPQVMKQTISKIVTPSAKKLLTESAPTINNLKQAAKGIYDNLENSGVSITSDGVGKLSRSLATLAEKKGFHRKIHPKVDVALNEFKAAAETGAPIKLSQIEKLRRILGSASKSIESDEVRLGGILTSKVDDFLDNAGKSELTKTDKNIGAQYRDARQLWRRVKKSEQLEEVFNKAQLQASGFENGIRTQFRSILNSKKQRKGFTNDELSAMKGVVKGTSLSNTAKMIGRFGFNEGQASNMLMGTIGVGAGAAVGGPVGAVAVPLIGSMSRKLAQRLTREGGKNADLIIKAGKNGLDLVKAYMKMTPPKERSAKELTELLLRPDINFKNIVKASRGMAAREKNIVNDAAFLAGSISKERKDEK